MTGESLTGIPSMEIQDERIRLERILDAHVDNRKVEEDRYQIGMWWVVKTRYAYTAGICIDVKTDTVLINRTSGIGSGYYDSFLTATLVDRDPKLSSMPKFDFDAAWINQLCMSTASVKQGFFESMFFDASNYVEDKFGHFHSSIIFRCEKLSKMFRLMLKNVQSAGGNHPYSKANKKQTNRSMPGIYCLVNGDHIKVGSSERDAEKRAKSQCVAGITEAWVISCQNPREKERRVHDFMHKRMAHSRGDWFIKNGVNEETLKAYAQK